MVAEKESRRHARHNTPEGTLVIVSPGADRQWTVQAIDISLGGLAFVYQGSREDLDTSGVLKILSGNCDFENIDFQTVSDQPASRSESSPVPTRRRGVKFLWKGEMQMDDLDLFIKNCCT